MGPADYLTIASSFHTVAITSIPALKLSSKNQARRFISLIDALYEARCRILCLAEADPNALFFPDAADSSYSAESKDPPHPNGGGSDVDVLLAEAVGETRDVYRPNVSSYDAPNMAEAPSEARASVALEQLSMFSGKDEQFAYKRALSRLLEMTSEGYEREEQWSPLPLTDRKWEQPASASASARASVSSSPPLRAYSPSTPKTTSTQRLRLRDDRHRAHHHDFAEEAAFERQEHVDPSLRPEAPRLRDEHVWGVRDDWGERAKAWGRGAKVYERDG